MYNKAIMAGYLTRDIELRYFPSGGTVANSAIATNRRYKGDDGEMKEEVCFIDLSFFGRTAEIANQYLNKGSLVLVEGRLSYETWTDQTGGKRSRHKIQVEKMTMLGKSEEKKQEPDITYGGKKVNMQGSGKDNKDAYAIEDNDEIPF